jgi:hypothetical protein
MSANKTGIKSNKTSTSNKSQRNKTSGVRNKSVWIIGSYCKPILIRIECQKKAVFQSNFEVENGTGTVFRL